MTLGNVKFNGEILGEDIVIKQVLNEALNGTIHGYVFGKRKRFRIRAKFVDKDTKKRFEDMIDDVQVFTLDTGEKYRVRISNMNVIHHALIDGVKVYDLELTLEEAWT